MTTVEKKLLADAMNLPVKARIRLVERLLHGIQADAVDDVQASWKAEIKRRVEAFERGELGLHSGDQVLRSLKKKYAK
jgi:putative addiction module component (TIGR02574 family)